MPPTKDLAKAAACAFVPFVIVGLFILLLAMMAGCSSAPAEYSLPTNSANALQESAEASTRLPELGIVDGKKTAARMMAEDAGVVEPAATYVDEKDLPDNFEHDQFPRIVIDGVKMTYDPTFPEPHAKARGAYRSDVFGCEMMWLGLGKDLQLSDYNDFRDSDQSKYGQRDGVYIQNIDGDIRVVHREQRLQIMHGGKWRDVKHGDRLRQSFVDQAVIRKPIYKQGAIERIGKSELLAELGADAWHVYVNPTAAEARRESERIRDANLSQNWRD